MNRQTQMAGLLQIWAEGQLDLPSNRITSEPLMDGGVALRVARDPVAPFTLEVAGAYLDRHDPEEIIAVWERARGALVQWMERADNQGAKIHHVDGPGLVVRPRLAREP